MGIAASKIAGKCRLERIRQKSFSFSNYYISYSVANQCRILCCQVILQSVLAHTFAQPHIQQLWTPLETRNPHFLAVLALYPPCSIW